MILEGQSCSCELLGELGDSSSCASVGCGNETLSPRLLRLLDANSASSEYFMGARLQ